MFSVYRWARVSLTTHTLGWVYSALVAPEMLWWGGYGALYRLAGTRRAPLFFTLVVLAGSAGPYWTPPAPHSAPPHLSSPARPLQAPKISSSSKLQLHHLNSHRTWASTVSPYSYVILFFLSLISLLSTCCAQWCAVQFRFSIYNTYIYFCVTLKIIVFIRIAMHLY